MTVAYRNLVLSSAPAFYYPLNETAAPFSDLGSAGVAATVGGSGIQYQQADAWGGTSAITLPTAAEFLEIPDNAALDLTGPFTLEALVKYNASQSGKVFLARWSSVTSASSWYIGCSVLYPDRADFSVYLNGAHKNVVDIGTNQTPLNDGPWHHIAGVYNGAQILLYVDGVSKGTPAAATGSPINSALPARMGRLSDYNAYNYIGSLSHVAIYPSALSPNAIMSSAAEVRGRRIETPKIRSYAQLHNRYFL